MGGLARLCKQFGAISLNGEYWIFDYEKDEPRKKSELSKGEIAKIEKYKWKMIMEQERKSKDT